MTDREREEAKLLIELIKIGQEGTVRPDNGRASDTGVCNSTGVVRDANYCKAHLENIWALLGTETYFGYNKGLLRL